MGAVTPWEKKFSSLLIDNEGITPNISIEKVNNNCFDPNVNTLTPEIMPV